MNGAGGYRPYPAYKDSGVEWLGEVPAHWKILRSKAVLTLSREKNNNEPVGEMLSVSGYRGVEQKEYDFEERKRTADELADYRVVRKGQLVVNTMWLNYSGLGVSSLEGYVSPAYRCYFIKPEMDGDFLHHLLRSSIYIGRYSALLYGIRPNSLQIKNHDWDSLEILIPPLPEQRAIAAFLDRKTAEIDALIAAKERLIALLREKRAALITQAVTKGLDPDVPLKDSGVEWLGEVPGHWEVKKIKHLAQLKSGEGITALDINESGDFAVFGGNGIRGYANLYTHSGSYVLIGRQGALCGNINYADGKFWASEHAVVAHPLTSYNVLWFGELLRSMNLNQYSVSAAQPGLAVERIANLTIPVPPVEEQHLIGVLLERQIESMENVVIQVMDAVSYLREYRTALISAAVTGKIDVRDRAIDDPNRKG